MPVHQRDTCKGNRVYMCCPTAHGDLRSSTTRGVPRALPVMRCSWAAGSAEPPPFPSFSP
eukprot:798699-Lingulodinium_polyedra.AAC.1